MNNEFNLMYTGIKQNHAYCLCCTSSRRVAFSTKPFAIKLLAYIVLLLNMVIVFYDTDWWDEVAHGDPDSKVHGDNVGTTWGRQVPGGPHVGSMKLAIWGCT